MRTIALALLALTLSAEDALIIGEYVINLQPGAISYNYEALLVVCKEQSSNCTEDSGDLLMYATLIPEKLQRGTQQSDIKRPDRHWIIEIKPGVSQAAILRRCGRSRMRAWG